MTKQPPEFLILANNNLGHGLSGGDQIYRHLVFQLSKKYPISVIGSPEAKDVLLRPIKNFIICCKANPNEFLNPLSLLTHQLSRTLFSIKTILAHMKLIQKADYIYSISDFYPDLIPAFIAKLINRRARWIAGYYLVAPNPFSSTSPYNQNREYLKGWLYFLGQIPTKLIVRYFADYVFVTSDPDKAYFPLHQLRNRIFSIQGGVENVDFQKYKSSKDYIVPSRRHYDACFLGRLHPQKGVLQLVDIWKNVIQKKPKAKLAIIGNGQLEQALKQKIARLKLAENIDLLGFLDGDPKIRIFQNSKVVVHPAVYDSGGMAAAEAMAWGLPGVSFDLPALKTYYPFGMLKTKCFDNATFATNIIKLIDDPGLYHQTSTQALQLIQSVWVWEKRIAQVESFLLNSSQ
jgi:glycosyltransferase involved in cell wall biosynthesis